jgi:hypothetical protein
MTAKRRTKRILTAVAFLFALYFVWLGAVLLRYHQPRVLPAQRKGPPFEIVGAYHIHTRLSDGRGSPEKVAEIASRRSLDFIILTDHGNPNLESLATQGWKDGVLVLAGSEISVSRGHLVALDFEIPNSPFPQNADQAAREVTALGGFAVIAHPFSKTRWSWGEAAGYSGIEIIDTDSMIKKNLLSSLPYLPALLVKPGLYLLKTIKRPIETLRKWDELNARTPMYGYYSTDAHFFYSAAFSCFKLHVPLPGPLSRDFETARGQIFGALRKGNFYSAIDAARQAGGFLFWARRGKATLPMGSKITFKPDVPVRLRVRAPFPFATEVRLIQDGETVVRSDQTEISYAAKQPGVYRVEVYLRDWSPLAANVPWIASNPIFLKEAKS